jgi:hypothetical protein
MRRMKVRVEDYHIRCGANGVSDRCPIALAITPMLPAGHKARVYGGVCTFESELMVSSPMHLPPEARAFVERFDKKEPVQPFEFELLVWEA